MAQLFNGLFSSLNSSAHKSGSFQHRGQVKIMYFVFVSKEVPSAVFTLNVMGPLCLFCATQINRKVLLEILGQFFLVIGLEDQVSKMDVLLLKNIFQMLLLCLL